MSTYTVLTITNTADVPIHLGMMLAALEQHAGWTNDVAAFDGETLDHESVWANGKSTPLPHAVRASWHSKYSFSLDGVAWSDLSKFLGPDFSVEVDEEFDDEGPGHTNQVWINGEQNVRESAEAVMVSCELIAAAGDALTNPTILTWAQVSDPDAEGAIDYTGQRFLVLPAEKEGTEN